MRRTLARIQFALNTIQYQMMHYIFGNTLIRSYILKLLKSFPKLENFLRQNAVEIRQEFVKKRILYQRSIHPTMVIKSARASQKIHPQGFQICQNHIPSVDEILQRIDKEL